MKITCDREKFSQLFLLVATVTPIRDLKPILQNVKLIARDDKIILMATDTEIAVRGELSENISILEPGEAMLPTRLFTKILQESKDKQLTIDSNEEKTIVSGEYSFYQLQTAYAGDYPNIESFNKTAYHLVAGNIMKDLIRRTKFSIEIDNARYAISGVLFEFTEGRAAAISTDGRRLSNQEAKAESVEGHASEGAAIFSVRALGIIEKAINDTEKVKVAIEENKAIVECGTITIHTQLIQGRFPRWRNILPGVEDKNKIDIIVGTLNSAVRQAKIVAADKDPSVIFHFNSGILEISAQSSEVGESRVQIPIAFENTPVILRFDPRFILDFLAVLEQDRIISLYFSENSTILFQTDDGYSYVVMPLAA